MVSQVPETACESGQLFCAMRQVPDRTTVTDHVPEGSTKRRSAMFSQREYLAALDHRVSIYRARAGQTGCRNPKLALATDQKVWLTSRALSKDLAFMSRNSEFVKARVQLERLDGQVLGQMRLT